MEFTILNYYDLRKRFNICFIKFVSNINRKVNINDVGDILNLSTLPYCDVFIGNDDLCDIILKIKTHEFLNKVKVQKANVLSENKLPIS